MKHFGVEPLPLHHAKFGAGCATTLLLAAFVLVAAACSGSPLDVAHSASKPRAASSPRVVDLRYCADLSARALADQSGPTAGVVACQNSREKDDLISMGVYDDTDFFNLVTQGSDTTYKSETYCGIDHAGDFVYALTASDGSSVRLQLDTDQQGLVSSVGRSPGKGCPQGLR